MLPKILSLCNSSCNLYLEKNSNEEFESKSSEQCKQNISMTLSLRYQDGIFILQVGIVDVTIEVSVGFTLKKVNAF